MNQDILNNFQIVVNELFIRWEALKLAVKRMERYDGQQVAREIKDYFFTYCINNYTIAPEELEDLLSNIIDNKKLDTPCKDNSTKELSRLLVNYLKLCLEGKFDKVRHYIGQLPNCINWLDPNFKISSRNDGRNSNSNSSYGKHIKVLKKTTLKRQKKYRCHLCNYITAHKPNLTRHIRVHTGEKPFVCKVCSTSFTQKNSLDCHEKLHNGLKPFECSVCFKTFSRKGNLQSHLRIHIKQLAFACPKCGQRFAKENEKQSHEKRCNCRRFECYLCEYETFDKSNLKHHMRSKHTGEKPFECAICDMKFYRKSNLKQHLATHTKPRPIRCSKCWKSFKEENKKNTHEGQCNRRLYHCYLCKLNATVVTNLKNHMKSKHTGEMPFACTLCRACFVWKIQLVRHMAHHYGLEN